MRRIVIVQPRCELYRTAFYERLRSNLEPENIALDLVHGESNRYEAIRTGEVERAIHVANRYFYFGKKFLVWQPALRYVKGAELVILQQNSANLINYPVLLRRWFGSLRVAFWGHGRNLQQGHRRPIREGFKAWYSKRVDHWFAYTDLTRRVMEQRGFPAKRITVVNNAIDQGPLIEEHSRLTAADDTALRKELNIPEGSRVALYCGRLYSDKRLDFLMESARALRNQNNHFHFILVGEGELEQEIVEFAKVNQPWVHFVGPKYGLQRVPYFRISTCQLSPGMVGLSIVDSFSMLTPLITTDIPIHSPEIEYLRSGVNGIITPNSVGAYVDAVSAFLCDDQYQAKLNRGCDEARRYYTVENMAGRFAEGVMRVLDTSVDHPQSARSSSPEQAA